MLKIRLQRTGRKHEPTYRLVLTDSKNSTKSGKLLEVLGSHDSRNDKNTSIVADRVKHWLSVGAKATGTVHNMLISNKIIEGKKVNVLPKKTVAKVETPVEAPKADLPAQAETPVAETPASVEETPTIEAPTPEPQA